MFEMVIDSIRVSLMNYQRVVILKEKDSDRYLPIWIGQAEGSVVFKCYKDDTEPGYVDWCSHLDEPPSVRAILLNDLHSSKYGRHLDDYEKSGPFSNLLWFPENYRRQGENRREESFFEEVKYDSRSLLGSISNAESWKNAINYFVYRDMSGKWWDSKFFFHR